MMFRSQNGASALLNKMKSVVLFIGLIGFVWIQPSFAYTKLDELRFQRSVIDKRGQVHRKFKKIKRKKTRYIIVHTSEGGLKSTLTVVTKGKLVKRKRITYGGHANYVIARDGCTFRTLDKKYRADHAGLSMWNGETNISNVSIGIELVGYHYTDITDKQYRSLGLLIDALQDTYHLTDRDVLTHSQVAYGKPNRWIKRNHRGRKRCAKNFIRKKAGLDSSWRFDPDVKAARLLPDEKLAAVYYGDRIVLVGPTDTNIITKNNSAWSIAGEDYDSPTTLYKLPDGKRLFGDQVGSGLGWDRIPPKTVVMLNYQDGEKLKKSTSPIKTIIDGTTAWTFAGSDYRSKNTYYFFPDGDMKSGRQIFDWDDLPRKTKIIVGYHLPRRLTTGILPIKIAGKLYKDKKTVYFFPDNSLVTGNTIKDFKRLPKGVLVFLPKKRS